MFWGLTLKPNRKYTQITSKPFHISLAALDSTGENGDVVNRIYLNSDDERFLICTLRNGTCEQFPLDMNFEEGESICFQSIGNGNVSLSGYIIAESDMYENGDGMSDDNYEVADLRYALNQKSKAKKGEAEKAEKPQGDDAEEDDEDEDDSDFEPLEDVEGVSEDDSSDDENAEEEQDDDDESEDDDEDDAEEVEESAESDGESDEEVIQQPKAKQPKLEKSATKENGAVKQTPSAVEEVKGKKDKKNKKDKKKQQQPEQQKAGGERTLTGGVKIEDIRVGTGPEAKPKKKVQVYYEGRLKNNKVFDSMKQGPGFKFKLDNGDVIKGWDVGVAGMKVGGKRRIICPPHMAYGARGSPPAIPPNSTLVFEVELKSVS